MNIDDLYKVVEISEKEIKSITDNGKYRSKEEIDSVYKLMDIIKDFYHLEDMGVGYSGESYGRSYRESYGRGGGAKRYADGRYSRMESRYSRGGNEYIDRLHDLMDSAPDDKTRQSIQRMIQQAQE